MKLSTLFEENENEIWFLKRDDAENLISTTKKEFDDLEIYQKKESYPSKLKINWNLIENLKKSKFF